MNIPYLFVCLILVLWIYWLWIRRKFYALMLKIPGPMGYPLIGMGIHLMRREDILSTFNKETRKYGSILFSWLGPYPFLVVSEPAIVQDILTSRYCINKGVIYDALDDGTGKGLFSLKDPEWSVHRKLLNPAFGHKVLLSFIPIFNVEINKLLKTIDQMKSKESVDLMEILQEFTLDIATKTTMGKSVSQESNESNTDLLSSYQCVLENMTEMCFSPWLRCSVVRKLLGIYEPYHGAKKKIRKFIRKLIDQKLSRVYNNADSGTKNIFIDLAIDLMRRGIFSWQNVEDESNVIVFGAFETTANTIAYTLMLLAMFPNYQEKVFEELLSIFPDQGDFEVSYSNTQDMIYMDMVLNETMRVMTPVPIVSRQTSQEVRLSNGVILPKGVQIAIDIFHMHRRVDIWGTEAHLFNPYNFLPSNMEGKHPYAYIPFTKGIRNCIGWRYALLSTKVSLAKLLRNYSFTTEFKYEDLEFVEDITLKLKNVPLLSMHKRTV
ncbi:probable cytochrome P450 313a4 isoform X1 [Lucilia sericata]|uniref:probable cytochrome P450 313a4 isoform X1 n=1 Tax=Lucilia sericata TaxID=13632 RepID=UPI0018A7EC66|nr:probable cytochrome P450 313a4 isoform X1 [Lucilia sericata]